MTLTLLIEEEPFSSCCSLQVNKCRKFLARTRQFFVTFSAMKRLPPSFVFRTVLSLYNRNVGRANKHCLPIFNSYVNRMCTKPNVQHPTVYTYIPIRKYSSLSSWATSKSLDWNRAVSDAEKIVGYPTSYFSLRCLLSDEISNIALHLRKLVGSNHPLLKTAKRLIYNGRNNMQTRGLIVLLISKAAGHPPTSSDLLEADRSAGISQRQRSLAEITEMIHTAHLIHKCILNLSQSAIPDCTMLHDMQFGNKISVLSGDYLLANACRELADLRNCKVVDLISKSIADFMQAEFLGDHDKQGNPLPAKGMGIPEWEERNYLWVGSLMANSCQATLELAGHDEKTQQKGYDFGKNLGLAWQVHSDLQPFTDAYRYPPGAPFDLTSLPVIFHLEQDDESLNYIQNCSGSVDNLDFKMLHAIFSQSEGVNRAKTFLDSYAQRAQDVLEEFGQSDATKALYNIIQALRE